jgi:hypothetical protein
MNLIQLPNGMVQGLALLKEIVNFRVLQKAENF